MLERRTVARMRCYLGGIVEFDGRSTMSVLLTDISRLGARAICGQNVILPSHIKLVIAKRQRRFPAKIIWQAPDQFGLRFLEDGTDTKQNFSWFMSL
ncbi:MAG TPA: PilZ domain-containing protein [Methylocella sp.]|nr:PilZ domain-containing protein [Methylocella sp.]